MRIVGIIDRKFILKNDYNYVKSFYMGTYLYLKYTYDQYSNGIYDKDYKKLKEKGYSLIDKGLDYHNPSFAYIVVI